MRGPVALCVVGAAGILTAHASPLFAGSSAPRTGYSCSGQIVKIFDNTNGNAVVNGARTPSFTTNGKPYCLTSIQTYHWNGGHGATPGALSLKLDAGTADQPRILGPFAAKGSAGQNGAPNVNWLASVTTSPSPSIVKGVYDCVDSAPATWSANTAGGPGFCIVYGIPATALGTSTAQQTTAVPVKPATTTQTTEKERPKADLAIEISGPLDITVSTLGYGHATTVKFRVKVTNHGPSESDARVRLGFEVEGHRYLVEGKAGTLLEPVQNSWFQLEAAGCANKVITSYTDHPTCEFYGISAGGTRTAFLTLKIYYPTGDLQDFRRARTYFSAPHFGSLAVRASVETSGGPEDTNPRNDADVHVADFHLTH